MAAIEELRGSHPALQPLHHGGGIAGHHVRRFGVAFVGASPAIILGYGNGRRERPLHAGNAALQRGDATDLPQQLRIARGAQPDVVREQRGANDVALPVHGIDAEQQRNGLAAFRRVHRGVVEGVGQRQPFGRRGVVAATGIGVATGQDRAKPVAAHIVGGDAGDVTLHQLADLFLHRHAGHQVGDALLQRRVRSQGPDDLRPGILVGGCGGGSPVLAAAAEQSQHQCGDQRAAADDEGLRCHGAHPSICSSSLPLVSCTCRTTKITEITAATR